MFIVNFNISEKELIYDIQKSSRVESNVSALIFVINLDTNEC